MKDFYLSFLEDIKANPKTMEEIKALYPNEWEAIFLEVRDRHLLSQYNDGKYTLSFEARFKLLDYRELQEARKAAKESSINSQIARIQAKMAIEEAQKSNKLAWRTIKISVAAILIGISINLIIAIYQTNQPISLNESTIEALIKHK